MRAAQRGDSVDAARWYRLAAEAGSRNGAFNLGLLLAREGSEPEAARVVARAADAGHGRAALRLALIAARRGALDDARTWCDRAVECGPAEVAAPRRAGSPTCCVRSCPPERAAAGAVRLRRARAGRAGPGGPRGYGFAPPQRSSRVTAQRRGVEQLGSSLGS